jgi:hypothetical protein
MCQAYVDGIQTQAAGAFDLWAVHAERAGKAFAGILDELLVPDAYRSGSCTQTANNPSAIVLTPQPLAHFMVCGTTSLCQSRCATAIRLFEFERKRVAQPVAPPSTFDITVESPLFNLYASADPSESFTVLAMASLPSTQATPSCLSRCGPRADCLALVRIDAQQALRLDFFCIPDPALIQSSVFPTTLDSLVLEHAQTMLTAQGYTLLHVDLVWTPGTGQRPIVLGYTSLTRSRVAFDGVATIDTLHEIWAWDATGARDRIVGTDDLAAEMLVPRIETALFGETGIIKPQIGTCSITVAFPAFISDAHTLNPNLGQIVLFVAFTAQIQGWQSKEQRVDDTALGHTLEVIISWHPQTHVVAKRFYVPCPLTCDTRADATCKDLCLAHLDQAIALARTGTFLRWDNTTAFFLPSASAGEGANKARRVRFDAAFGLVWSDPSVVFRLVSQPDTVAQLGTWTRASVFSLMTTVMRKPVRDARIRFRGPTNSTAVWFQAGPDSRSIGPWFTETRLLRGPSGWKAVSFPTQQTTSPVTVTPDCHYLSCAGCASPRLRLLCHQAEDCVVSQCVGTIVQTRDVLCGIGSVVEQSARHAITTWRSVYAAVVELAVLAMRGLAGDIVHHITLHFPTDQVRRPPHTPRASASSASHNCGSAHTADGSECAPAEQGGVPIARRCSPCPEWCSSAQNPPHPLRSHRCARAGAPPDTDSCAYSPPPWRPRPPPPPRSEEGGRARVAWTPTERYGRRPASPRRLRPV